MSSMFGFQFISEVQRRFIDTMSTKEQKLIEQFSLINKNVEFLNSHEAFEQHYQVVQGLVGKINSPIGVALTSISGFQDKLARLKKKSYSKISDYFIDVDSIELELSIACEKLLQVDSILEQLYDLKPDVKASLNDSLNVTREITKAIQHVQSIADKYNLEFAIEIPKDTTIISCRSVFQRIVIGIIYNICLYGLKNKQQSKITFQFIENELSKMSTLTISDNGTGIDAQDTKRAFDPFADLGANSAISGFTMVAISNLIVNTLHGQFDVSTGKHGSVYQVSLAKEGSASDCESCTLKCSAKNPY